MGLLYLGEVIGLATTLGPLCGDHDEEHLPVFAWSFCKASPSLLGKSPSCSLTIAMRTERACTPAL